MRGENAQTVYRTERKAHFTQIPNEALRDERLSWRARGLLAYMLSFPDDWAHRADDLQHVGTEGREAVRSALRELEAAGYRTKVKERGEGGKFRTVIVLRDHADRGPETRTSVDGASVDRASLEDGHEDGHEEVNTEAEAPVQDALLDVPLPPKLERPRNVVFDALAAVYPSSTKSEASLIGMVATELRALRPVPGAEEIIRRGRWAVREWPGSTPRALATHWTAIGERLAGSARDEPTADPQAGMEKR